MADPETRKQAPEIADPATQDRARRPKLAGLISNREISPRSKATMAFHVDLIWFMLPVSVKALLTTSNFTESFCRLVRIQNYHISLPCS